jgi:hypothetical protein
VSPRGAWSDAEWSAIEHLVAALWPRERLSPAQGALWRRSLEQHGAGAVVDALDALRERTERPALAEVAEAVGLLPARRAG